MFFIEEITNFLIIKKLQISKFFKRNLIAQVDYLSGLYIPTHQNSELLQVFHKKKIPFKIPLGVANSIY